MSHLEDSIDELFSAEPISGDVAQSFLEVLLRNYESTERSMYRRFTTVIFLWIVGYSVSLGMLAEASFLGVKVNDLDTLLLVFPFAIAISYYGMLASFAATGNSLFAVRRILKHHWKKVYENDLEHLVVPQTFLSMEIITYVHSKGLAISFHKIWIVIISATFILVPIACVLHMSYLSMVHAPVPKWLAVAVILVAAFIVIRAITLLVQMSDYNAND